MLFWQSSLSLHMEHQVSATDEFNDKEQPGRGLEAGMKSDQKGMVGGRFENVFFCLNPINVLKKVILMESLFDKAPPFCGEKVLGYVFAKNQRNDGPFETSCCGKRLS